MTAMKKRLLQPAAPLEAGLLSPAARSGASARVRAWAQAALQRAPILLAVALVASVVSFGIYYYTDRQVNPGPSSLQRQTAKLEEAVSAQPDSLTARLALASAYETSQRYPEAILQYQAALEIDPESTQATLGLGRTQLSAGDLAGATASFQSIVEQRQGSEFSHVDNYLRDAHYYLGEAYLGQQQYDAAVEQLQAALAIDYTDADGWWRLCQAFAGAGDAAQAVDSCRRAVLMVPNFAEAYQSLAQAYQMDGQALGARYAAAMVSYSGGRHGDAASELQAVVAQDPSFWDAWVGLGLALEGSGDRDGAVAAYQQALTGDPENLLAQMGVTRLSEGGSP